MHKHPDLRDRYPEVERPHRLDGRPNSVEKCLEPVIKNIDRILELVEEVTHWKELEYENTFVFQSRAMGTCKQTSDIDIYIQLDEKHRKLILECGAEYADTGVKLIVGATRIRFLSDLPQKILDELKRLKVDLYFGVELIPPAKGWYRETKYYINLKDLQNTQTYIDPFGRLGTKYYKDGELWVDLETLPDFKDGRSFYDEDYFLFPSDKGGYGGTMKWDTETRTWWEKHAENLVTRTSSSNALDVGCGMGRLVHGLIVNGIYAWGLEISEYAVKNSWGESTGRIIWGDITNKDVSDKIEELTSIEEFDLTVAYEVFEHIPQNKVENALDNFAKLTRKGGYSHIAVPNSLAVITFKHDPTHVLGRPERWWREEFIRRGYEIIEDKGWTYCLNDDFRCLLKKVK